MKRAVEVLMDRGYVFEAEKLVEQMKRIEEQERMATGEGVIPPEAPTEEILSEAGRGAGI